MSNYEGPQTGVAFEICIDTIALFTCSITLGVDMRGPGKGIR